MDYFFIESITDGEGRKIEVGELAKTPLMQITVAGAVILAGGLKFDQAEGRGIVPVMTVYPCCAIPLITSSPGRPARCSCGAKAQVLGDFRATVRGPQDSFQWVSEEIMSSRLSALLPLDALDSIVATDEIINALKASFRLKPMLTE